MRVVKNLACFAGTGIAFLGISFAASGYTENPEELESIDQLCVIDHIVGFDWANGDWVARNFNPKKYIIKKVAFPPATTDFSQIGMRGPQTEDEEKEPCGEKHAASLRDPLPAPGTFGALYPNVFPKHYPVCMSLQTVGESSISYMLCNETHDSIPGQGKPVWGISLDCPEVYGPFGSTRLAFTPNAHFHESHMTNATDYSDHEVMDSEFIAIGKCSSR
jgi:hypothetical protein